MKVWNVHGYFIACVVGKSYEFNGKCLPMKNLAMNTVALASYQYEITYDTKL